MSGVIVENGVHQLAGRHGALASQGESLAFPPPALGLPLHLDLRVLAQRRGKLLLQDDPSAHPAGVFHSIVDLQAAINRFLKQHNDDPKPFIWTKPVDVILAKLSQLPVSSV